MTKIFINNREEINFILTSDNSDDSYEIEVIYKNVCLFVLKIGMDKSINIFFGIIQDFVIDKKILHEVLVEAENRLIKQQNDWLKGKEFLPPII